MKIGKLLMILWTLYISSQALWAAPINPETWRGVYRGHIGKAGNYEGKITTAGEACFVKIIPVVLNYFYQEIAAFEVSHSLNGSRWNFVEIVDIYLYQTLVNSNSSRDSDRSHVRDDGWLKKSARVYRD